MAFVPEINPYIQKLEAQPGVLETPSQVWPLYRFEKNILELGCGNGHFLESYLRRRPGVKGLGLDLRYKRLFKTAHKIHGFDSHVLRWDIHDFLDQSPPEFWSEIWMQFPDPWPKPRHSKHRLITRKSYWAIYRTLKRGGRFCFLSDCENYYQALTELQERYGAFSIKRQKRGDLFIGEAASLFKLTFLKKNKQLFSIELRKY